MINDGSIFVISMYLYSGDIRVEDMISQQFFRLQNLCNVYSL